MLTTRRPAQPGDHLQARAILLAQQLELKDLKQGERVSANPLMLALDDGGTVVLFRYGAVVFFEVLAPAQAHFQEYLAPFMRDAFPVPETEEIEIRLDPNAEEGIDHGTVIIHEVTPERLQVVADILGKSVMLARYESSVASSFDQVEPLAEEMQRSGQTPRRGRRLARYIGSTLLSLHQMVGRAEVGDKPEILWEHVELERLYARLESEFEIRDRQLALERKLDLISRTVETLLELLEARRTLRVEWYIVILIVVEILLTLYELFVRSH